MPKAIYVATALIVTNQYFPVLIRTAIKHTIPLAICEGLRTDRTLEEQHTLYEEGTGAQVAVCTMSVMYRPSKNNIEAPATWRGIQNRVTSLPNVIK